MEHAENRRNRDSQAKRERHTQTAYIVNDFYKRKLQEDSPKQQQTFTAILPSAIRFSIRLAITPCQAVNVAGTLLEQAKSRMKKNLQF